MFGPLIALAAACLLDIALGDPPSRLHPVAAMGKVIHFFANAFSGRTPAGQFLQGVLLVIAGGALFTLPWFGITMGTAHLPEWPRWILIGILLKPTFAFRRLVEAGNEIANALERGDLAEARRMTGWHLVSRDTSALTEGQVASAVVESLAENLTDSFLAPLFFFSLLGPLSGLPAAWLYRFVNTADAMIGYHTERFEYLGKFAARLDDALNWLPARIAALCLAGAACLCGLDARNAWQVMRRQHARTSSPNAGWTMSAAAGALDVRLEKLGCYRLNETKKLPDAGDIRKTNQLIRLAALTALLLAAGMAVGWAFY